MYLWGEIWVSNSHWPIFILTPIFTISKQKVSFELLMIFNDLSYESVLFTRTFYTFLFSKESTAKTRYQIPRIFYDYYPDSQNYSYITE